MGKKKQGKRQVIVETTNLEQFKAAEEKKDKEKEILKKESSKQSTVSAATESFAINPHKTKLEQMLKAYRQERDA